MLATIDLRMKPGNAPRSVRACVRAGGQYYWDFDAPTAATPPATSVRIEVAGKSVTLGTSPREAAERLRDVASKLRGEARP